MVRNLAEEIQVGSDAGLIDDALQILDARSTTRPAETELLWGQPGPGDESLHSRKEFVGLALAIKRAGVRDDEWCGRTRVQSCSRVFVGIVKVVIQFDRSAQDVPVGF